MKAIIILYCCVALFPTIIFGASSTSSQETDYAGYESKSSSDDPFEEEALNEAQAKVDKILENNGIIKNVFRPMQFLGRGGFSNTYKGELIRGNTTKMVAMKFSPTLMMEEATVNEYEMYTYMRAIDNSSVENYGIPAVYYYGEWDEITMIAITLLDSQFHQVYKAPQLRIKDIDIYIICREFVIASKYMHAHGVCHEDTKIDNLMFRKNRGFIIDFNISNEVFQSKCNGDCRKRDWESFFLSMFQLLRLKIDEENLINNVKTVAAFKHLGLRRVLGAIARYAYTADPINYNHVHQIITEEIQKRGVREPALVSWLTNAQKSEAIAPSPDIRSISDPPTDRTAYTYPEPNVNFFANTE